jgi:hypothetical protein
MILLNSCKRLAICLTVSSLLFFGKLHAQGHYAGGSFNPNDYFIPANTGWVFPLYYGFSNSNFYDASGSKSNVIEINQNPPVTLEMGQNVKTHSIIPMMIYFGKGKILNARWGFLALPIFNNPNANIALDYYLGQNLAGSNNIEINSFGAGDFYLQPVWLTWEKKKLSTTFSYGFWMTTGKYKPNNPENVGLGYWSHNFRVASRYKPTAQTTLTGAFTYEVNQKQQGVDFTEAPHLTFDYGASYNFIKGHEIGLFGFGTWQTGDDKGEKAVLTGDHIYGIGAYGAYWLKPGRLSAIGRINKNFGIKNRYGGFAFQVGLNYLILK